MVLLGMSLWAAHSAPGEHHMGKAAAVCLAVAAVATAAVATLPALGRMVATPARSRRNVQHAASRFMPSVPVEGRARGHPSVLQVFRR